MIRVERDTPECLSPLQPSPDSPARDRGDPTPVTVAPDSSVRDGGDLTPVTFATAFFKYGMPVADGRFDVTAPGTAGSANPTHDS